MVYGEFYVRYSSQNIIEMIKTEGGRRRIQHFEGGEVRTQFWKGILRVSGHLKDPRLDESIILKCIFKKRHGSMDWIDVLGIGGGLL